MAGVNSSVDINILDLLCNPLNDMDILKHLYT